MVNTNGTMPGNGTVTSTKTKVCSTDAPEGLFTAVVLLLTMTLAVHRLVDQDVVPANICIYSKNTKYYKMKGV